MSSRSAAVAHSQKFRVRLAASICEYIRFFFVQAVLILSMRTSCSSVLIFTAWLTSSEPTCEKGACKAGPTFSADHCRSLRLHVGSELSSLAGVPLVPLWRAPKVHPP